VQPADHFVATDGQSLALMVNRMDIDIVAFYAAVDASARLLAAADFASAEVQLRECHRGRTRSQPRRSGRPTGTEH
jgi:hypothetical protein